MKNNNTDKYFYLSQNKDFGLVFMRYSEEKLLDFEQAIKEYVESGCTEEAYEEQAEYGYSDVLNWYNGTITTEELFEMVEEEWQETTMKNETKTFEITDEFRAEVCAYLVACGSGIVYDENGKAGVDPEAVEALLVPELIDKTRYIIEERRNGHHINLIDFDEWAAISNVLNLPELTFDDAMTINTILWANYEVSPLELEPSPTPAEAEKTKKAPSIERD